MASRKRPTGPDDLAKLVSDLIDQIKVLVSAVDDLRCEVEWWARNAAEARLADESAARGGCRPTSPAPCVEHAADGWERVNEEAPLWPAVTETAKTAASDDADENLIANSARLPARDRLKKLERDLGSAPQGKWPSEWNEEGEPPELPIGRVIPVDEALWSWVLDLRPAHVVEMGCCCQEGIGAPYLLAWQDESGSFLRELTEEEAIVLQRACLASQIEAEKRNSASRASETQLGLW